MKNIFKKIFYSNCLFLLLSSNFLLSQTIPDIPPSFSPNGYLSITSYGASTTNSDNTTQIQNCINAAKTQNKDVYIPAGTFKRRTLTLDGVMMYGDGDTSILSTTVTGDRHVILRGNGSKLYRLKIISNATSRSQADADDSVNIYDGTNCVIYGVTMEKAGAASILTRRSSNCIIAHCKTFDSYADSIHITENCYDFWIHHNEVYRCGDDGVAVVSYGGDGLPVVTNIVAYNNKIYDNLWGRGMSVVGGKNIIYHDNEVYRTLEWAPIIVTGESSYDTYPCENIVIRNNKTIEGGGNHAAILVHTSGERGPSKNIRIENNYILNPKRDGIRSEYDNESVIIAGNIIENVTTNGIEIYQGSPKVTIVGNTIRKPQEYGIITIQNSSQLLIDKNIFYDISVSASAHDVIGVSGATPTRLQVTNNSHGQPGGYGGDRFIDVPSASNVRVSGNVSPWSVNVPANSGNQPPVANNFTLAVLKSDRSVIKIATTTFLANTSDTEGNSRTFVTVHNANIGKVYLDLVNAEVTFEPTGISSGSFMYTVSDGYNIATATCTLTAIPTTIYYVDPGGSDITGSGSSSSPWKTLAFAVSNVPVGQGCTVHLNAGTFTETQTSVVPVGVNIEGAGITSTILRGSFSGNIMRLVSSNVNGNQTISGLTIDGMSKTLRLGILVQGRHYVTIHDVNFQNIYRLAIEVTNGVTWYGDSNPPQFYLQGIKLYNLNILNCGAIDNGTMFSDIWISHLDGAEVHDIVINENATTGITGTGGNGWYKNTKIYNCNITVPVNDQWHQIAVELWNIMDNNEMYNVNTNSWFSFVGGNKGAASYSLKMHDCSLISGATTLSYAVEMQSDDLVVSNNYFTGYGYCLKDGGGATNWQNHQINNNVFYDNRNTSIYLGDSKTGTMSNIKIFNNIFHETNKNGWDIINILFGGTATYDNLKIENNIFICDISTVTYIKSFYTTGVVTNGVYKNNLLYKTVAGSTGSFTTSGNINDTNPLLQATGAKPDPYYRLQAGSPCIDKGIVIPGITDGYLGAAPDIGRYESSGGILDTIAPSAINNLSVSSVSSCTVVLNWTSMGDDGTTGTATSYDIRYATYSINTVNWDIVTQFIGEPSPKTSGNSETFTVTNLSANTTYYFGIKAGDEVINWGNLSNITSTKTAVAILPDTTSPGNINNLTTSNPTTTSIVLNWTSVGDDGTTGTAATYDIRHQTYTITAGTWGSATQCNGEPIPQTSGTNESFTATGLISDTTYYFGIKAADEIPNTSGLSNIASGKTQAVVLVDSTAPATVNTLSAGNKTTNSITLNWVSVGDDGTAGTATTYDIRYQTYTITSGNFTNTTQCTGEPTPNISGTNETFIVSNLTSDTTYYFAMKAGDEVPNWSVISNVITSKTVGTVTGTSPISEWQFEEGIGATTADTSGNSNIGTLYNSPQWVAGAVGSYGLQFDGLNTYVSITDNSTLDITTAITLEAWVKTDVITTDGGPTRRVIDKGVYVLGASDQAYFKTLINGISQSVNKSWSSSDISLWHHIVGTYDSIGGTNNLRLYQDGVLVAQATVTGNIDTNNNALTIGRQGSTTGRFDGTIDEMRIYNRALTANEVLLHYQGTIPEQDTTSPNAINNLATSNPTTTTLTLNWTAVGDDGLTGTATSYDIRYATYNITTSNFSGAQALPAGGPTPKVSGSNETYTLSNLTSDTTYYIAIKVLDERGNISAVSNISSGKTQAVVIADSTPPSAVDTLASNNPTYTSITLQWTAVGDDGATGTATLYDIRYLLNTQITASNFATAIPVSGEPTPSIRGTQESYTINNLSNGTTYYFAMKVGDEIPNWSDLSNIISARTIGIINDTIAPNQITTLSAVTITSTTIVLNWIAPGDDNEIGTATTYDIRYTTQTTGITANSWASAMEVTGEPILQVSGCTETFTLTGLTENTIYYIAIKAVDDAENNSELSYILTQRTNPIPQSGIPNSVSLLAATQLNNNSIQLNWQISTSSDVASYRIYIATGDIAMDYTSPSYVVVSTQTQIAITGLTANQDYKFVVRAVNGNGNEDTNTAIISEVAVVNVSDSAIKLTAP
ncbi:MAG: hypothetical protein A2539_07560, partial [Elusimicrobia bacterium RIFOXYD2_FULL_34_15]